MTFGITFIHIWIFHSFNKLILTNLWQNKTWNPVLSRCFISPTINDLRHSQPHWNYNSKRFFTTFTTLWNFTTFLEFRLNTRMLYNHHNLGHFSLVLAELRILNLISNKLSTTLRLWPSYNPWTKIKIPYQLGSFPLVPFSQWISSQ